MKKVVVTGSQGFIGKNLIARLGRVEDLDVIGLHRESSTEEFNIALKDCDLVYHLAGVNRPKEESEFISGNLDYTSQILQVLSKNTKNPTLVVSSSSQAEKENPYGTSKRLAEDAIEKSGVNAVVFRLPGVFGKWSRPNYNSVVSTFCYNVANKKPLEVRDPSFSLPLVYVDDVVESFIKYLDKSVSGFQRDTVKTVFQTTLGELAEVISSFPLNRKTLHAPAVGDTFTKYLYSTYLSYLPESDFSYPMELKVDNRGDLFEWIKSEQFGQIFVSTTKPGITRGNHYHHTKTEKFLVIRGEAVIRFRKLGESKVIEYPVSGEKPTVVDIPTGYTHNITNTGDTELITLFWANEIFDTNRMDTYFEEV